MNPEVSYLVVCYNSEKYITKCIQSILEQTHKDNEIIVIDNNSQDDTLNLVDILRRENEKIKLISNKTNIGYGNALTIGIDNSKGEYLAMLNADTVLDKEWTSNLLHLFRSDGEIMSACGKILFPNSEVQSSGGMMDKYGAVIQRESKLLKTRKIQNAHSLFYNDGSSFMIKRNIFNKINFDTRMFLYYEDVDLSWKVRMLNYQIGYSESALSYHDVGHSSPEMTPAKFYYLVRNRLYICLKNYSIKNIINRIPMVLFLIFLNAFFYDSSKKTIRYTIVSFKALWWNVKNLKWLTNERKKLHLINKISDNELDRYILQSSIELSYKKSD